uniref:Putative endodeoxyribonuclease n=1 Tax=viral metagenome TaxID=1070528 RepID=A0A6H1ZA86_9ZZZZ
MSKSIFFEILGQAVPKGRPKFARIGKFIHTYTPKKTKEWERTVKMRAAKYKPAKPFEGAVTITLCFYLLRPKSLSKKVLFHIKKPDGDNLGKAVLDALEGDFYKNDSQIVRAAVYKGYSDTVAKVVINIEEIS